MSNSRQNQRPLPSHPHALEYRAPKFNPPTHTHVQAPRLRKSMSRVLSRVISITRKEQPPTQATMKEGNVRIVHIDRGYEVIPRVTSTHLKRSQNGLREVETNVPILDPQHSPRRVPKEYPSYSHPQISDRSTLQSTVTAPSSHGPGTSHRQSITTKLSRNQIANFRKASTSSQASLPSSTTRSTRSIAGSDEERALLHKQPAKRGYRDHPGPRRHLASSRSTAEMKGRSSGESTRPSSSSASEEDWAKTPVANRLVKTRWTPSVTLPVKQPTSSPTPYQFVCPEKLIQRKTTTSATPPPKVTQSGTTPSSRPRAPVMRSTTQSESYRKPVPMLDSSPCSTSIEIASTNPEGIRMSIPVNESSSQSLDDLFDEVMNACLTDGDGFEDDRIPLLDQHIGWDQPLSPMSSPNGPVTPTYRGQVPLKTDSPTPTNKRQARSTSVEPTRFIPSGRSFEPIRKTHTGPLRIPSVKQASPVKEVTRTALNVGSRVKDVIAKFEMKSHDSSSKDPSTPVRVLGSIINRPSSVSSAGLSSESRRLMWEARQSRVNR